MRIPVIAGNWKMNMKKGEARDLLNGIRYGYPWPSEVEVVVSPPYTLLDFSAELLKDSYISVAAQNLYHKDSGAYTGEISGAFLKDIDVEYVIIGHSERRQYFSETDQLINKKVLSALKHGLKPILCVGETLSERESGVLQKVIATQVVEGLASLSPTDMDSILIAYEPVWAIGTGKTATPDQAQDVHELIRKIIEKIFDSSVAEKVRILYGGSMKPANAKDLLSQNDIDGGLIGGASLKADQFIEIIKSTSK